MTKWPRIASVTQQMRPRLRSPYPKNDRQSLRTVSSHYTIATQDSFSNLGEAFANALVQAGSCRKHSKRWACHGLEIPAYKRITWVQSVLSYNRLPLLAQNAVEDIGLPFSKPRLRGLVDYYEDRDTPRKLDQTQIEVEDESNTVCLSDEELEDKRMHLLLNASQADLSNLAALHKQILLTEGLLDMANNERHVRELEISLAELWKQYQALFDSPKGRILCLNRLARQSLLHIFETSARQVPAEARRFLSLLDDMKTSGIPVTRGRWNTAIHIVGRSLGEVRAADVENALRLWTSVATERGLEGDMCTFNILLDVAVKGGQFSLAEMVLREMQERNLKFDRYTRTGLIYYHGVRGDGNAIRKAYWEYAEEEVLIETAALNAVIAALIRAGEPEAAQHVYQRMKEMAKESKMEPDYPPSDAIAAVQRLLRATNPHNLEQIRQIREQQRVSPDAQTYWILVAYHVNSTGDLDKIADLLSDMQYLEIPSHGRIFCELFRGFNNRGGTPFTLWTTSTLDRVWTALVYAADRGGGVYWEKWISIWALRAYTVCAGRKAALEKWEFIKRNWRRASDYDEFMHSVIIYAESAAARHGKEPKSIIKSIDVEIDEPTQLESGFRI